MINRNSSEDKKKLVSRREFLVGSGAIIASAVLFNSLAACTPKTTTVTTTSATGPKRGGVLKAFFQPANLPIGWPAQMNVGQGVTCVQVCLETLLRLDPSGNLHPLLAESYKVADDLKSMTFNLRKGVKFHDGSDFNAEVAKWNLNNMIEAKALAGVTSVDVLDDYTIRANFGQWINTLPLSFGNSTGGAGILYMVSKAAFDKNGVDWMRRNPVGTGPFKFSSFAQDASLKFVRNPDYWQKDKPYLDGVDYYFVVDSGTLKISIQSGEGDMTGVVMGRQAAEMKDLGLSSTFADISPCCLIPDTANSESVWAKQQVREAAEYAIDRESIAKNLGFGYWKAPYQISARGSPAYDPDFTLGRKFDAGKAKNLLDQAGLTGTPRFKTTIICFSGVDRDAATALQAYFGDVGIQAELDIADMGRWVTYLGPGTWPKNSLLLGPVPGGASSGQISFIFRLTGKSWLRTPEYMQAFDAMNSSPIPDVKLERAVTDLITKDASIIPVYESGNGYAIRPYVNADYTKGLPPFGAPEDVWLNK